MTGLVVGDPALLGVGGGAGRLHSGGPPPERGAEVLHPNLVGITAAGEDRGLVADVRDVRSGQARGLPGEDLQIDAVGEWLVAGGDVEDGLATDARAGRDE